MEADLQDLGVDLRDLWTGLLSVRRAAVLASQLAPGARVWSKLGTDAMWAPELFMAAALLDAIHDQTWVLANKDVEGPKRSQRPKPIPRPGDLRAEQERTATIGRKALAWQRFMERRRQHGD